MSAPRDALLRQSAAMERVQELACAHGFDADADAQRAIYAALLAYAAEERDALIAALLTEYVAILRYAGFWGAVGRPDAYRWGGRMALQRAAECLDVTNLHDRAAAHVLAHQQGEQP